MGPRDEPELNLDDAELAAAEAATRRLLAPYDEPAVAEPPPGLAARVAAALPARPPVRPAHPWRRLAGWAVAAGLALLLTLGVWGVLVNSLGPARVASGAGGNLGELVLVLTLAAKPLVNLLASAGPAAGIAALAATAAAWLWWRVVRATPIAPPLEPGL